MKQISTKQHSNDKAICLIQYAKEPVPGKCKTRLMPTYTAQQAAQIAALLTENVAAQNQQWQTEFGADWQLHYQGNGEYFVQPKYQAAKLVPQVEGDLGRKMTASINAALTAYEQVLLMGSDCLTFSSALIAQVLNLLANHDLVLVPAEDGGYLLIASKVPLNNELSDVTWGSPNTLQQSLDGLKQQGHSVALTDTIWDVDYAEDLARAKQEGLLSQGLLNFGL